MNIQETELKDCYIVEPRVFGDDRGCFYESYNKEKFDELVGKFEFIQDNEASSSYGVVRGLHFQTPPYAQSKLVRCVYGKVLDVAVDLRKSSPTYGKSIGVELSAENKKQLFVPKGFAHGYAVLSDRAIFSYKVDAKYSPQNDSGILWNSSELNIDWMIDFKDVILSEKDKNQEDFSTFKSPFD